MTANKLREKFLEQRGDDPCDNLKFDGYSGFFMRSDAPSDFHECFSSDPNDPNWGVNGTLSALSCNHQDLNDLMNSGGSFQSKDQIIGLLFGLNLIEEFVDDYSITTCDGVTYNVQDMACKIAKGMVEEVLKNYQRELKFPCDGPQIPAISNSAVDGTNEAYALFEMLERMCPTEASELQDLRHSFDTERWRITYKAVFCCGWDSNDNVRMGLEMATIIDRLTDGHKNYYEAAKHFHKGIYPILNGIMHNNLGNVHSSQIEQMMYLLCKMPCTGPCLSDPDNPDMECDEVIGWCADSRWRASSSKNTCDEGRPGKSNGVDFMLGANIMRLAYACTSSPLFDPLSKRGEYDERLDNGVLSGPDYFCDGDVVQFTYVPDNTIVDHEWNVSDNVVTEPFVNGPTILTAELHGNEDVWVEIYYEDENGCKRVHQKRVRPFTEQDLNFTVTFNSCRFVRMVLEPNGFVTNGIWRVTNTSNNIEVGLHGQTGTSMTAWVQPTRNSTEPMWFEVEVEIVTPCGIYTKTTRINLIDCELIPRMLISPNPSNGEVSIGFENVFFYSDGSAPAAGDVFSSFDPNISEIQIDFFNSSSVVQKSTTITTMNEVIDISELEAGVYVVCATIADLMVSETLVKQ